VLVLVDSTHNFVSDCVKRMMEVLRRINSRLVLPNLALNNFFLCRLIIVLSIIAEFPTCMGKNISKRTEDFLIF
jgi:hypothetical protein